MRNQSPHRSKKNGSVTSSQKKPRDLKFTGLGNSPRLENPPKLSLAEQEEIKMS